MASTTMQVALFLTLLVLVSGVSNRCKMAYPESSRGFGTSLQKAVIGFDYTCVKEFLDAGDSPNRFDRAGNRPVHFAASRGFNKILQLLHEYGADPTLAGSSDALTYAACGGYYGTTKILLDMGTRTTSDTGDHTAARNTCSCDGVGPNCPKDQILELIEKQNMDVSFNTDLPSTWGILNDGENTITLNNRACKSLCDGRSDCKAWTRIKRTGTYGKKGECWLRKYQPEGKPCDSCDSGFVE